MRGSDRALEEEGEDTDLYYITWPHQHLNIAVNKGNVGTLARISC